MLNFGALPPEVNSAKMYAGPGSGPLLAAAAAWNAMATELRLAATHYDTVIKSLVSDGWLGPSAGRMVAAVEPYVAWLQTTAAQAEQAGTGANAAAAAYEAAFAATVPPPAVAANRALLANLVASNIVGQNTASIAATEAQYGQMWAQDAAAMTGYHTASRAATPTTAFGQPQSSATTDGTGQQSQAVARALAAAPAAGSGNNILAPGSGSDTTGLSGLLNTLSNSNPNLLGAFLNNNSVSGLSNAFTTNGILNPTTLIDPAATAAANAAVSGATTAGLEDLSAGLSNVGLASAVSTPGAAAAATVGQASSVGALSVPPAWAGTGATVSTVAETTQVGAGAYHSFGAATPMVMEEAGGVGMPGVPLAGLPGAHDDEFAEPIYGFRPRIIGRPPAAG
ncbi:hypothetical protein A5647_16620 [Mycobacterium sp. 1100029.7]|nr:hypothetical protein A5647_16620 [Mycobacterium sp. 1100029.7]